MQEEKKLDLLKTHGFRYQFDRELYFNRDTKKIFSSDAIDDHDIEWLKEKIKQQNDDIAIYFNKAPTDEIVQDLKRLFKL